MVHVVVDRELWDRITRSVERTTASTGLRIPRAEIVRSLLKKGLAQEEAEGSGSS